MPELFTAPFANGFTISPWNVLIRLVVSLLLGLAVAWIHARTTKDGDYVPSFFTTLVLLSVLIAMVTQVIGDNVARAFSLVGALSIVRFRTIVRDTRDTAYVIFSVAVGMSVGAHNLWVAVLGIVVVGIAAFVMARGNGGSLPEVVFQLRVRVPLGHDPEKLAGDRLDVHLYRRELMSISMAKQGTALDYIYETRLRPHGSGEQVVKELSEIEGVQDVRFERRGF